MVLISFCKPFNQPNMLMKNLFYFSVIFVLTACYSQVKNNETEAGNETSSTQPEISEGNSSVKHFKGALSNGMKGDSLSFDVSADGKKLENLTFKGWWRCSGKLEIQRGVGPDGFYEVNNGHVDGHISEPPNGGSTAWRFDIKADIEGKKAVGNFRMNINDLGCDTYLLKFEAFAE